MDLSSLGSDKGIFVVVGHGEKKYISTVKPIEHSDGKFIIWFDKVWDIVLQPARRPDGMLAMDKGIIPTYKALNMSSTVPGIMSIPDNETVIIARLDPLSEEYKDLISEAAGIAIL